MSLIKEKEGLKLNDNWWKMIRVIKTATQLPELVFMAREMGIPPIIVDSLFLGLAISSELKRSNPKKNYALFDSGELLQIVEYSPQANLLEYMKDNEFEMGYTVNKDGSADPIKEK